MEFEITYPYLRACVVTTLSVSWTSRSYCFTDAILYVISAVVELGVGFRGRMLHAGIVVLTPCPHSGSYMGPSCMDRQALSTGLPTWSGAQDPRPWGYREMVGTLGDPSRHQ